MFWIITALVAGYLAAIYTWPKVRTRLVGVETAIASLRDKARALEAKIKTFVGS